MATNNPLKLLRVPAITETSTGGQNYPNIYKPKFNADIENVKNHLNYG